MRKICQLLFKSTNLLRIFAGVLEKIGFVCEGTLRHNAVKNGAVLDMKMYVLTR